MRRALAARAMAHHLTTHSTGRAISLPFIENLGGFGGLCAPVNSSVRFLLNGRDQSARLTFTSRESQRLT
jgi:hypothetical protein